MEPDFFVPGDQQFQPLGIAPLVEPQGMPLPDFRQAANVMFRRKAAEAIAGKVGLGTLGQNVIGGLLGVTPFAPLAGVSALSGQSLGIADYLRNKRAQKAARRERLNDPQGDVQTYPVGIMSMQPDNRDSARGAMPQDTRAAKTSQGVTSAQHSALRK